MNRLRSLARCAAGFIGVIAVLVLAGWATDLELLKRGHPGFVAMNPLTALCFLLACMSLLLLGNQATRGGETMGSRPKIVGLLGARIAGALVGGIGLLLFLRFAFDWDCGLDQLLFRAKLPDEVTGFPNRMAPNTALAFLLSGAGLVLVSLRQPALVRAAQLLAVLTTLAALLAVLGYAYHNTFLYGVTSFIPMALPTALAFLGLGLALLFIQPDVGLAGVLSSPGMGGRMARRLLPAAVIIPATLSGLRLWGERQGLFDTEFAVTLHTVIAIGLFTTLVWWTAGSLEQTDAERRQAREQILNLNAQLEQRAVQLEAANQELESFSYSVSHDLRAPLRHVHGFVDLLTKRAGASLDEQSRRYLKVISDAARKMGQLIDDLLIFSRMGRIAMQKNTVLLEDLVREAIASHQTDLAGRSVEWVIHPLPPVEADRAMLRQVVVNLIDNAIKYTRSRTPARIEFGCLDDPPAEWVFYIRDNGAGFDMRYAHKLFGVFQRLHSEGEFEGTGIGLANIRRIITRHAGRTWAEGKVAEGATFYFSLPKSPGQSVRGARQTPT